MNRFRFLAALFGFGAAAQVPQSSEMAAGMGTAWDKRKPKNNECPVCGTMAEPFHKPRYWDNYPSGFVETGADGRSRPVDVTRCKHCNAAFWRDAE